MTKENLRLYSFLSRLPLPESYPGKIMLIAFLGTHVPVLALIFYFVLSSPIGVWAAVKILSVTLIASLLGTAVTFYLLYLLLAPISLTSEMLRSYITDKKLPDLPTDFGDRVGRLMADVQYTVKHLDETINTLEELSMTDYLTKVYNRNGGEKRLNEDISRAARNGDTMSLVMLDIDDFKLINDQHGHAVGDSCLKHVVDVITGEIRKGDWVARWGGDEFILLMLNADEEASEKIMNRIVEALRENSVYAAYGDEINLTLSMGICEYGGGDDENELFRKADKSLLEAKRKGKGQIVCHNSPRSLNRSSAR